MIPVRKTKFKNITATGVHGPWMDPLIYDALTPLKLLSRAFTNGKVPFSHDPGRLLSLGFRLHRQVNDNRFQPLLRQTRQLLPPHAL